MFNNFLHHDSEKPASCVQLQQPQRIHLATFEHGFVNLSNTKPAFKTLHVPAGISGHSFVRPTRNPQSVTCQQRRAFRRLRSESQLLQQARHSPKRPPSQRFGNELSKDVQSCVKECARGVRDRMQRATRICRYFLCSSLFGAIEEIKCSLVAYGMPCGFLDFDRGSHPIEKNANTLWKSKTIIWKVPMSVFETKTCVSDTNSIIGFGACEASSGETLVLLLVSETWIWKYFHQAEIARGARRLLVMELKRSVLRQRLVTVWKRRGLNLSTCWWGSE